MTDGRAGTDTAVVIGAGIAGLSAAGALSDRFGRVVVLDRDNLPADAVPRRGVPQGHHPHGLLVAGQRALDELFPGLCAELVASGAETFDMGTQSSLHVAGAILPRTANQMGFLSGTRPFVEHVIRRRVIAMSNVEIRDAVAVTGLTGADGRVTGVRLDSGDVVACAFVVDCSGRGSRSDRWLADLGFPAPPAEEVKIDVRYTTRQYRRRDYLPIGRAILILPQAPRETIVSIAVPAEDDRWLVTIGGFHGDSPGTDEIAFKEYAHALPEPSIAGLIEECQPLTDLVVYHFPTSRRRYFEKLDRVPAGYLALGDSMCSFNPVYAQGMTVAALEAVALRRLLGGGTGGGTAVTAELSRAFYRAAAEAIATPWQFAVMADFVYPQTEGRRPRGVNLINRYTRRLQLAAHADAEVRRLYTEVLHMVTPPDVLQRPAMMWRVLRASRRFARQRER